MTTAANDDHTDYIDRAVCLCDVGQPDYLAVVAVGPDGEERVVLADRRRIGDDNARYDATTPQAPHEQLGPLSLEFVHRIAVAARTHRCGRRTCRGRPCRLRVEVPGQACEFHRDDDRTHR